MFLLSLGSHKFQLVRSSSTTVDDLFPQKDSSIEGSIKYNNKHFNIFKNLTWRFESFGTLPFWIEEVADLGTKSLDVGFYEARNQTNDHQSNQRYQLYPIGLYRLW